MIPTSELRFVERVEYSRQNYFGALVRILQQKWVNEELRSDDKDYAEWRDVPLGQQDDALS